MPPKRRSKRSNRLFDDLVANAIDFATKSIKDLERSPKYSMIHFDCSLELFLKARLLLEHWSLIVSRPDAASLEEFRSGRFHSVSLEEAMKRLRSIANEPVPDGAAKSFRAVREHRNRLVHFFHPGFASGSAKSKSQEVAVDQYKAWHFLSELVTGKWQSQFKQHQGPLRKLDRRMHKLRGFLLAKYNIIKPKIESDKRRGAVYETCGFCDLEAVSMADEGSPLWAGTCQVCGWRRASLHVPCPECERVIVVEDMGEGSCKNCGHEIDLDYLLEEYGPARDPKEEAETAYCSECEHIDQHSVIPHGDNYLCLYCLTEHDRVGDCGHCSERVTEIDHVASSVFGCMLCSGAMRDD